MGSGEHDEYRLEREHATMERLGIIALMVAIGSGLAIGIQATLNTWSGKIAGSITTGLFVNFAGGVICGIILLVLRFTRYAPSTASITQAGPFIAVAGAIGIAIITGIAYALPRTGIAAGLAAVILGQLLVATVVDSFGWGGAGPIPLSGSRVASLLLLALATFLLLQRR